MLVPEQSFEFTRPQDFVTQRLELFHRNVAITAGIAVTNHSTGVLLNVPGDRFAILMGATATWVQVDAGISEHVAMLSIDAMDIGGTLARTPVAVATSGGRVNGTQAIAGGYYALGWDGQVWLPPSSRAAITAYTISLPAQPFDIHCSLFGFTIPRGSLVRG